MTWESCCRGRRSTCPEISVEGDVVRIRDDDGNQIRVTLSQFEDIRLKLNEIVGRRPPPPKCMGLYLPN